MQSCNDALMQIGAAIGVERFTKYQKIFGFGEMTGVDLPGEADTKGLIHTAQNMSAVDLATNSFGQNYNTTMVQTAAAFCSVINGGSYYRPHVAKQILSANGAVKENLDGKVVRETVSMETTEFLREALRKTVAEGTGSLHRCQAMILEERQVQQRSIREERENTLSLLLDLHRHKTQRSFVMSLLMSLMWPIRHIPPMRALYLRTL